MEYKLPAGCYFHPTNKDLVKFLTEKVKNDRLPPYIVPQKLYGEKATEPWNLFRGKVVSQVYFFTSLDRKTPHGSKFERTTGHGTWKGQANIEIKKSPKSNTVIGNKKNYRFELKKGLDYSITGCLHPWRFVMHEYSLPGNERDVICKIIRYPPQKSGKEVEVEELMEEEAQVVVEQSNTSDHQEQRPLEPSQNTHRNKRSRVVRCPSNGEGANNETKGSELRTEQVQSVSSSAVGNPVQQQSEHQEVYNNYPNYVEMMQPHHVVFDTSSLDAQSFNLVNESLFCTNQGDDNLDGLISSLQDPSQLLLSTQHISTAPPRVDESLLQPLPPQLGNLTASSGNIISNAMPSSLWSSSLSTPHYFMRGSEAPPPSLTGEVVTPPHVGSDGANLRPTK